MKLCRSKKKCRNINLLPIDFAFRLRLRGRLTLPGIAWDRKPWAFGERDSHPLCRYSCQHSHFQKLHSTSRYCFTAAGTLLYRSMLKHEARSFGVILEPRWIYGANQLDQWAITLSLKDGCFQAHLLVVLVIELPFPLSCNLRTLTYDLGYFPFDWWLLAVIVCLLYKFFCIRSLSKFSKALGPPHSNSALPQKIFIKHST